jgi:hypothetical protein
MKSLTKRSNVAIASSLRSSATSTDLYVAHIAVWCKRQ